MALGYCMICNTLRSIKPGAQKWGSRECEWFPIRHDAPARHATVIDGVRCGGVIFEMETVGSDDKLLLACETCEVVVRAVDVVPSHPCDGHKKAIK